MKLIETGCPNFQAQTVYPDDVKSKFTIVNVYDSPEQSLYKAKLKEESNANTSQKLTTLERLLDYKHFQHFVLSIFI
jgi:hypothetical protein